ncbi:hypothetical protein [Enterococcus faecium]|uniref:hypothetical protein n=1 Tax=Enterococcus faecium TaxID=1352 RepID=UPI0021FE2C19|nr:hypothetical protein [Enterococcus faecium]BDP92837.1 hypothetical protein EfmGK923_30100 [Enterococcus faecium]BDP96029.1 hypothetical protein EfmGK941_30340 [Enterococcus faecium]BDP99216.1 hypothetical protein EfmGK961_30320 [Enterococcus faecium]
MNTRLNYFSRTLINNLLKDTTGISVSTKHFANDLIIFEDSNLQIEMFIEQASPNSIPEFCYTYTEKMKHAKSVKDIEALSVSLTNALTIVKKAKMLFEFQTDYHNELVAQSEILD